MTEITHDQLDRHLDGLKPGAAAPVYLIHGEEMLRQQAVEALCARLLGPHPGVHQIERLDGASAGALNEALARVNTYSLLGDARVVILSEARLFHDALDTRAFLEKARQAQQDHETAKAARALMTVLGFHRLEPGEVDAEARRRLLDAADMAPGQDEWLAALVDWCRQQGLRVPAGEGDAEVLTRALERGFPAGHHLIVTAEAVDRRRKLFKVFERVGSVVDCTVPAGDRRADREVQQRVLQAQLRAVLGAGGKRMGPEACDALLEMTGFHLRTFVQSLEKLMDYTGRRTEITAADVRQVLSRSRQDPVYALTGAVGDGHLEPALQALDSLLEGETHPLQILAALVNQTRRWILARGFLDGPEGQAWSARMSYGDFQRLVVPVLQAQDRRLRDQVAAWHPESREGGKRRRGVDTDLVLVKNPQSAYPVYLLLKQAQRFSGPQLQAFLERLTEADRALKGGAASGRLALEALIFSLCRKEAPCRAPRSSAPSDRPAGHRK